MNFELLLRHLPQLQLLPEPLLIVVGNRLQFQKIKRGQHLKQPGEPCKHLYFVCSGFLRHYIAKDGIEQTLGFASTGQLYTLMKSFFMQQRSAEGLICDVAAEVYSLSYHEWRALEDLSTDFLLVSKAIMEEQLLSFHAELAVYRLSNATQKYRHLCQVHPQISVMVSQKHVASFLGITEQSMSVIRKNILRNT